jgi:ABC-type Fe3+-hydroxamate transport system substrate-binding protein
MFTDQMGREIDLRNEPKRIISVVPSQTELLFDLGLADNVIGVTRFCIHPASAKETKTIVGGTKNLKLDVIEKLEPDLIIANKEENEKSQIEALAEKFPVWISDIHDLDTSLEMIQKVGEITGCAEKALSITNEIEQNFTKLQPLSSISALYLIWRKPWMSIGSDTFIHHMLTRCGFENVCGDESRYPVLSDEDIKRLNPSIVLLSSEPYPFKEKHISEIQMLLPSARIELVDGEMFSWYGSRLLHAPQYLNELLEKLKK